MQPRLSVNLVCSQGCPFTALIILLHILGLQTCSTVLGVCSAGDQTQGLMHIRQVLCQLNLIPSSVSILKYLFLLGNFRTCIQCILIISKPPPLSSSLWVILTHLPPTSCPPFLFCFLKNNPLSLVSAAHKHVGLRSFTESLATSLAVATPPKNK